MRGFTINWLCVVVFALLSLVSGAKAGDSPSLSRYLRDKYDELPENGKFAAGAAVGFGASRIAVKSAVTVVKVAGAIYITTEVMNAAGVLDDIPRLSEEQTASATQLKKRVLLAADDFRATVRKRLNPENLKSLMQTDRMATLGVATGAVVGLII